VFLSLWFGFQRTEKARTTHDDSKNTVFRHRATREKARTLRKTDGHREQKRTAERKSFFFSRTDVDFSVQIGDSHFVCPFSLQLRVGSMSSLYALPTQEKTTKTREQDVKTLVEGVNKNFACV